MRMLLNIGNMRPIRGGKVEGKGSMLVIVVLMPRVIASRKPTVL
jgi:hypothetical protein